MKCVWEEEWGMATGEETEDDTEGKGRENIRCGPSLLAASFKPEKSQLLLSCPIALTWLLLGTRTFQEAKRLLPQLGFLLLALAVYFHFVPVPFCFSDDLFCNCWKGRYSALRSSVVTARSEKRRFESVYCSWCSWFDGVKACFSFILFILFCCLLFVQDQKEWTTTSMFIRKDLDKFNELTVAGFVTAGLSLSVCHVLTAILSSCLVFATFPHRVSSQVTFVSCCCMITSMSRLCALSFMMCINSMSNYC